VKFLYITQALVGIKRQGSRTAFAIWAEVSLIADIFATVATFLLDIHRFLTKFENHHMMSIT
jgi:hypothetical protein